ncbi:HEPN domain-containing protein [Escherichia coli]|uniref:HEPN domain-containing protein n=1 Tax=Escherichia coli TaxID=562 RepID=A0A8T6PWF2_ECOLX|nr:HEPN domain-containing protein [Escherichia coli]
MNKNDLESLAAIRFDEANCLINNGLFHGAYYLCGYSVECALKACIAKTFMQHEFPNKKIVIDSYTHDLSQLLKIANLHQALQSDSENDSSLEINWTIVKDWSEQYRYEQNISQAMAAQLRDAVGDQNSGVLTWVKAHW